MDENPIIDGALDASTAWNTLAGDVRDTAHARFVRNERFPDLPGTYRVSHVTASSPEEIDALLTDVAREVGGGVAPAFDVDYRTPPPFEARLVLDGYERRDSLVMLLEGDPRGEPPPCDIREVDDDAGWRAWEALSIADNTGAPVRPGVVADEALASSITASRRAKCPPVRYFLACVAGEVVGFFSSWEGIGGVGVTENLYVEDQARGRGIATALLHACVADARAHGARAITLSCNPDDWPKSWYARLGFAPVAVKRMYSK